MANLYDYIKWRGDLTMKTDPFNEIDGLILSELVYVDFENVVSTFPNNDQKALKDVANEFIMNNDIDKLLEEFSFTKEAITLLQELAKYPRYQNILLSSYINELDYDLVKQFSAITFQLEDGSLYVAYRGTDDTILGWKEDFKMTYQFPVPSQTRALEYLKTISSLDFSKSLTYLKKYSNYRWWNLFINYLENKIFGVKIRIGGHSKGGNLAVYAASNVDSKVSKRIIEIYNNDGPGFNQEMLESKNYQKIANKIKKFIPESSVFGIMLDNLEEKIIVKSDAKGLMQHSGFSWQVEGTKFVSANELSIDSQNMNIAFKSWLSKVDRKTREEAIEAFFTILEAVKIERVNDLSEKSFSHILKALKEFKNMDPVAKNAVIYFFKTLFMETYDSTRKKNNDVNS